MQNKNLTDFEKFLKAQISQIENDSLRANYSEQLDEIIKTEKADPKTNSKTDFLRTLFKHFASHKLVELLEQWLE